MRLLAFAVAAAAAACAVVASPAQAASSVPEIVVLSGRADTVTGGDALVEVRLAPGARLATLTADGRDVTAALARRGTTRPAGLVGGLRVGETRLVATTTAGARAALDVINHPSTGPVLAGPQVQPWLCDTASHGLGSARDAACSTPAVTSWVYKSAATGRFESYDPAAPPASPLVATTTTDTGVTAPYVVRVEKGVMDRGLYTIAVLGDPARGWSALAPQPTWNGKLGSPFGGSCNPRHQQESVDTGPNEFQPTLFSVLDDAKLSKGFMVAHNGLGNLGSNCNDVVAAEALMMLEEHIAEQYGPIRYTIGYGCSGGSMLQHLIAANYPGLLDGIIPSCSFPDVWSTATESEDCHLLQRVFDADPTWTPAQQAAVAGYQTAGTCVEFSKAPTNNTRSWFDPANAAGCGDGVEAYDPQSRPQGVRCTLQDYAVAQLGRRPDGFANRPYDNVGVQYGLRAFEAGVISAEKFVSLNERVGGDDIDWRPTAARTRADLAGVRNAHVGGRVTDGRLLASVPILDMRGTSNQEIHSDYHSYVIRARLDEANGHHDNQVIWSSHPLTVDPVSYAQSFFVMDRWLAAIESDSRPVPATRKVVLNKPAVAVDSCFVAGAQVTDRATCSAAFPYYGDPRIAAGGRLSGGVLACALTSLRRPAGVDDAQWTRLQRVFPDGVCDPTQPGRQEERAVVWATYRSGAPQALGPAPRSSPLSAASLDAAAPGAPASDRVLPVTGLAGLCALVGLILLAAAAAVRMVRPSVVREV